MLASLALSSHAGHYRLKAAPPKNPSGGQIAYTNATVPYTNTASGYGASAIGMDFVNCTGQITATFEWVPDNLPGTSTPDELDVYPSKVIAAEYCEATFEASYYLPAGGAVGDASNDLGFELDEDVEPIYIYEEGQPVLIGYTVRGVSKGTRYTAVKWCSRDHPYAESLRQRHCGGRLLRSGDALRGADHRASSSPDGDDSL